MNEKKPSDEFDTFGSTMATKLRKLNEVDKKEAANCQFEVYKTIHEFEAKLLYIRFWLS